MVLLKLNNQLYIPLSRNADEFGNAYAAAYKVAEEKRLMGKQFMVTV